MGKYIDREAAVAVIEEKQKELCPVGRYGRNYVYGSDREKYDNWEEIIDALENLPAADVVEVVRCGQCRYSGPASKLSQKYGVPGVLTCHGPMCNRRNVTATDFCSRGARMDKEADHEPLD